MSDFNNLIGEIKLNQANHDIGYFNCIPFDKYPRFERFVPGIEKSTYYKITANSGIGKSKLLRDMFVHTPLEFCKQDNPVEVKVDILYFSLEESKKKVLLTEMVRYLHTTYGYEVNIKQLQSIGRHNKVPSEVLEKLEESKEAVENNMKNIHLYSDIKNPTGIYKKVRDFAYKIGRYYDKDGVEFTSQEMEALRTDTDRTNTLHKRTYEYRTLHPNHYVLVLIDHIGLVSTESDANTKKLAIDKMSSYYCLRIRDTFGFSPVSVQQQAADKEKVQYTMTGQNIFEKLEPSLDGLGGSKDTQRDANIILGLFAPDRYDMLEHEGYDINFFRDNYRSLGILKNRDGDCNYKVPLFFNGATDYFKELPRLDDSQGMRRVKEYVNNLRRN